jgi:hypothetical protein
MSTASRRWWLLPVLALALTACGGDDDADAGPFELSTSPEFVNMVIPGRRPLALVTATSDVTGRIELTATTSFEGSSVELVPSEIDPGEVAEIWIDLPEVDQEMPIEVTVDASRGDETRAVSISATAMPGSDDLESTASDIAAVFLAELAESVDTLPAATSELTGGTPVGGLLVVSHYAWFTDTAEIGLAWHVMVAPDDWAELTIRPRDQLAPTEAYRLTSWSTALAGGDVEIVEMTPPADVVR